MRRRTFLRSSAMASAMALTGGFAASMRGRAQSRCGSDRAAHRHAGVEHRLRGERQSGGLPHRPASWFPGRCAGVGRGGVRRSPERDIECWSRTSVDTGRRAFEIPPRHEWPSRRRSARISSTSPTRWACARFAVAGYDWGGRAACIAAALHPDRVRAAVLIGGYSIQDTISRAAAGRTRRGTGALVSVVFQHRARTGRARRQPPRALPAALANLVADLALHRRDVQQNGGVVRQPRFCRRRDPLLSAPQSERARRAAVCRRRAPARRTPEDRGPVDRPLWRRRWHREAGRQIHGHQPTARRSPSSSPAESSPARAISFLAKSRTPCRRRCWSCWRPRSRALCLDCT